MSNTTTKIMLDEYTDSAEPTGFLSGQFQAPDKNFHTSEEVEIDIQRSGQQIAIAVKNLNTGARLNATDLFTNKAYKPAIYREAGSINAHDLLKRELKLDDNSIENSKSKSTDGKSLIKSLLTKILL